MKELQVQESRAQRLLVAARVLLLLTALTPLIVSRATAFPFVVARNVWFRVLVDMALGFFIAAQSGIKSQTGGTRAPLDWAMFAFVAVTIVSATSGLSPHYSFFGDFERMGGVWSTAHYVLFYALLRAIYRAQDWTLYLRATVTVAVVTSVIGLVEFLHAPFPSTAEPIVSTVGNPGLLALYLFLAICVCALLGFQETGWRRIAWTLPAIPILGALLLTQNRTALLALFISAATALWYALRYRGWRFFSHAKIGALFVLLVAILLLSKGSTIVRHSVPLHTTLQRLAATGVPTDEARKLQWRAAVEGFHDRPILGYGPENYRLVWQRHLPSKFYTIIGGGRVDRAHNQYLEIAATTGILGIATVIGIIIALIMSIGRESDTRFRVPPVFLASVLLGYGFAMLFWFFDITSSLVFFAICALAASRQKANSSREPTLHRRYRLHPRAAAAAGVASFLILAWPHGVATLHAAAVVGHTARGTGGAIENITQLRKLALSAPQRPDVPFAFVNYLEMAVPLLPANAPRDVRAIVDSAFNDADVAITRSQKLDPTNADLYALRARLLLLKINHYRRIDLFSSVLGQTAKARELSPAATDPLLLRAFVYIQMGDLNTAWASLDTVEQLNFQSGQMHYYRADILLRQGRVEDALRSLRASLRSGYTGNHRLYFALAAALEAEGRYSDALDLIVGPLEARHRGFNYRSARTLGFRTSGNDLDFLARAPVLVASAGDTAALQRAVRLFVEAFPAGRQTSNLFEADVRRGNLEKWQGQSLMPDR